LWGARGRMSGRRGAPSVLFIPLRRGKKEERGTTPLPIYITRGKNSKSAPLLYFGGGKLPSPCGRNLEEICPFFFSIFFFLPREEKGEKESERDHFSLEVKEGNSSRKHLFSPGKTSHPLSSFFGGGGGSLVKRGFSAKGEGLSPLAEGGPREKKADDFIFSEGERGKGGVIGGDSLRFSPLRGKKGPSLPKDDTRPSSRRGSACGHARGRNSLPTMPLVGETRIPTSRGATKASRFPLQKEKKGEVVKNIDRTRAKVYGPGCRSPLAREGEGGELLRHERDHKKDPTERGPSGAGKGESTPAFMTAAKKEGLRARISFLF